MPECEIGSNNRELSFDQPWLDYAIPLKNGKLNNCRRYAPRNGTTNLNGPGQCSADMFDTSVEIACTEFVYTSNERNLQTEVWNCDFFVFFRCEFEQLYICAVNLINLFTERACVQEVFGAILSVSVHTHTQPLFVVLERSRAVIHCVCEREFSQLVGSFFCVCLILSASYF